MLGGLRSHLLLIFGIALVITGAGLIVVSIPFVTGWLSYLLFYSGPPKTATGCGSYSSATCQIITTYWFTPPNPYPMLLGYAVAVPFVLGIGWRFRGPLRGVPSEAGAIPQSLRHASVLLIGMIAWMGLFIATALAMDWLSIPVFPWARYLFLGSLLLAPSLVLVVGATVLGVAGWHGLTGRSRAARG